MNSKTTFVTILVVMLYGCAVYELPPLDMNHPANPQAMAAPRRSPSQTLAYTRAETSLARPAAAAQDGHDSHHAPADEGGQKTVVGEGKVIATVPSASQLVVEHGEIKDFMEPMTMGYRVEPSSLLKGLKAGDRVRFTIDVPKKTIVKIENLK